MQYVCVLPKTNSVCALPLFEMVMGHDTRASARAHSRQLHARFRWRRIDRLGAFDEMSPTNDDWVIGPGNIDSEMPRRHSRKSQSRTSGVVAVLQTLDDG